LEILGDGTQRKSYLPVSNTVDGILYFFEKFKEEKKIYDVYNLGSEDWITVKEIAEIASRTMNIDPRVLLYRGC